MKYYLRLIFVVCALINISCSGSQNVSSNNAPDSRPENIDNSSGEKTENSQSNGGVGGENDFISSDNSNISGTGGSSVSTHDELNGESIPTYPPIPGIGIPKQRLTFEYVGDLPFGNNSQDVACFQNNIYVLNADPGPLEDAIFVFSGPQDNHPISYNPWSREGSLFDHASGFTINQQGHIFVTDQEDDSLIEINPYENWRTKKITGVPSAYDVAIDSEGNIYLAKKTSTAGSTIVILNPEFEEIGIIEDPLAIKISSLFIRSGFLYASDYLGDAIRIYDLHTKNLVYTIRNEDLQRAPDRNSGLYFVSSIFVDNEGRIFWGSEYYSDHNLYYINDITDKTPHLVNSDGSLTHIRGNGIVVCGDYIYSAMGPNFPSIGAEVYRIIRVEE